MGSNLGEDGQVLGRHYAVIGVLVTLEEIEPGGAYAVFTVILGRTYPKLIIQGLGEGLIQEGEQKTIVINLGIDAGQLIGFHTVNIVGDLGECVHINVGLSGERDRSAGVEAVAFQPDE